MVAGVDSILVVRRSIHIQASLDRVWREFESFDSMNGWWGVLIGRPDGGTPNGQRLLTYEPRAGGRIEMKVDIEGAPARYGGPIVVFDPPRELTFENDWIPNQGWLKPTFITLRLSPQLGGTLVELMHHGFERTGDAAFDDHAGYEGGWGMTQLNALRHIAAA